MPTSSPDTRQNWQVYIILCSDNSLYTGITTNVEKRFRQHAGGSGAKYFRGRQPLKVVYVENNHSRSSASIREARIKAMARADKVKLVNQQPLAAVDEAPVPPQQLPS